MSLALSSNVTAEEKNRLMPVVMAMYEKARVLYDELAASGQDAINELSAREYVLEEYTLTLDYYYSAVRNLFVSFMLSAGIQTSTGESYMLWEIYGESAIRSVLSRMADLLLAEYNGQVYQGKDIGNIMLAFRVLHYEEKNNFFILGINQVYYAALERYFCSANPALKEMVPSLLKAEIAYAVYQNDDSDENKAAFLEEFQKVMALYEQMENKDQIDLTTPDVVITPTEEATEGES